VVDAATRAEYRTEIGQEFTVYFDEAQAYLRCLDAARAEVSEEINRAIRDYQAISAEPDDQSRLMRSACPSPPCIFTRKLP
jgi:hypothetical protein